ncbi:MAG TPA: hypothetical protein PKA63_08805 [Oligoflexia bacterium]|nr:hypothetical protein [Oligoflexia bacterium]HMP48750.1 hypothetical protein [Oligoflexia bacterium]
MKNPAPFTNHISFISSTFPIKSPGFSPPLIKKTGRMTCAMKKIISTFISAGFFLIVLLVCSKNLSAQVAITVGAQEIYDDNIFLENKNPRPVPVVFDQQIEEEYDGRALITQYPERFDGRTNSDFITNAFIGFSGNLQSLEPAIKNSYDLQLGALLFADNNEQNRFTVDGGLDTSLSNALLPDPYHVGISNRIISSANNLAAPGGTATQNVQNYVFSGDMGIRQAALARDTFFSLGYNGSYQKYLGEFFISSPDESDLIRQGGVDFHAHTGSTGIDYQVSRDLEVGLLGTGGVQLFTDIDEGDFNESGLDPSELDRINAEVSGTTKYTISRTLFFDGSAGMGYSKFKNTPRPREITFVNDAGETVTETVTPDSSNTGLTFSLALNYAYQPGSLATVGATQGFTTNLDGSRFISRVAFLNLSEPLSEDFRLVLGGSYMQFEDQSGITPDFDRFEGSISLNYHLTQATALVAGYNYTRQRSDGGPALQDFGRFASPEFNANRFFIGINTGFVGLPL